MSASEKRMIGFAGMDRQQQRIIASKGGQAAHLKGTAHEWTKAEAAAAGRKSAARRKGESADRESGSAREFLAAESASAG